MIQTNPVDKDPVCEEAITQILTERVMNIARDRLMAPHLAPHPVADSPAPISKDLTRTNGTNLRRNTQLTAQVSDQEVTQSKHHHLCLQERTSKAIRSTSQDGNSSEKTKVGLLNLDPLIAQL
jgi:hypothetical protein